MGSWLPYVGYFIAWVLSIEYCPEQMKFHTWILNSGNHLKLKNNDVEVVSPVQLANFS